MVKRKTYRKPQINQVKLVPEEAILAGCKAIGTGSSASRLAGDCPNEKQSCMNPGS